jgi:hypothetical protein
LTRDQDNQLALHTKYDPAGTALLTAAALASAIAVSVSFGLGAEDVGLLVGVGGFVLCPAIHWWRKRTIMLSLNDASEFVVDNGRKRIGIFTIVDHAPRWIVLQCGQDFAEVFDAIRDRMAAKCRPEAIGGVNMAVVIGLLVILLVIECSLAMLTCVFGWL